MSRTHSLSRVAVIVALAALGAAGCKKDKSHSGECDPAASDPCGSAEVCEQTTSGTPMCFAPLEVHGTVTIVGTTTAIGGATVVAIDASNSAISDIVTTAADGTYVLVVPTTRNDDGTPVASDFTLRVAGDGYVPFPQAPRYPIPVSTSTATLTDGKYVVDTTTTDVGLLALPAGGPATGTVSGTISGEGVGGALVVAVQGGVSVSTAVAGADGSYTLFNVPLGTTTIQVFRGGIAVDPIMVTVIDGTLSGQNLAVNTSTALGTVNGGLQFVDASNGDPNTSVILVPAATFDPDIVRGEAPAGLRVVVSTSGSGFSITGVPPGDYVVLAAFENDNLVRDPDETQGGTAVLKVTVAAGATVDAGSFKLTNALELIGPGGSAVETITTATPTFRWYNDPSSDLYELRVYDAFGELTYENVNVPAGTGNQMVSFALPGANALVDGMTYQWRLFSVDTMGNTYISASEDLEGVFVVDLP